MTFESPPCPPQGGGVFFERAHDDVVRPFDPVFLEVAAQLPMHSPIVIVGTDTDVGKTWVTGHLAKAMHANGVSVITQKWAQTGPFPTDIATHDEISGLIFPETVSADRLPYYFPDPVSPHLSAARVGRSLDVAGCLAATTRLHKAGYQVLIEGSGGLMVPYTETVMLLDILADAGFPVVLVSENRVGVINQVMLSVMALRQRGVALLGIILSQKNPDLDPAVMADNARMVGVLSGVSVWRV